MKLTASTIHIALGTFLQLSLAACSSSSVSVPNTSTTISPKDTAATVLVSTRWKPETKVGRWHYVMHDSSIISISNDTNAQPRLIESTTDLTLTLSDTASFFVLNAQIDSMTVTNKQSLSRIPLDTTHSRWRAIVSNQHHFINRLQQSLPCSTTSASVATRVYQVLIPLPLAQVDLHDRWVDTSSAIVCHGRISLTESRINGYELINSASCEQHDAITVHQSGSSTFRGLTAEGSNHLNAGGSGTESRTLCLQRDTGLLLSSTGESRLDLTVTTDRGVFPFTQTTMTSIRQR